MRVYGVSAHDVCTVIHDVSRDHYDGNLVVKSCEDRSTSRTPGAAFGLQVGDSHAGKRGAIGSPGHTGNGPHGMKRRSNSACWHAHWDVIAELLRRYPDARVVSGLRLPADVLAERCPAALAGTRPGTAMVAVKYTATTFREVALLTAHLNVRSSLEPVTMPQCCECDHSLYSEVAPLPDASLSTSHPRSGRVDLSWMPGTSARNTAPLSRDTSGYTSGYTSADLAGGGRGRIYPWDAITPAQPWTPRVTPGSATVADTLAEIDKTLTEA